MSNKGIPVPKVSFFLHANFDIALSAAMNRIYMKPEYDPYLFKWEGKPLLMADSTMCNDQTLKDHFTWRKTWAFDDNQWNFNDRYPQRYFTYNGVPEQMPVTKAMGAPLWAIGAAQGSSVRNNVAPPYDETWETELSKYGYFFDNQWSRAHQIDPSIVCITGWNELIAGAWASTASNKVTFMGRAWNDPSWRCVNQAICGNKDTNGNHIDHGWHFVDEYNTEFNRDMEPIKGKYTDNYYYQMISHIRKFKGMSAPEIISLPKSIAIDGSFAEWAAVTPIFRDAMGDTEHRSFKNVNNSATLTNITGRNDIIESRATFDANNIYFYVKTAQAISAYNDPNWMLLFIDVDRNKGTGWEGYDYVLNLGVKSETQTTLKKWEGTGWSDEIVVNYAKSGSEMEISFPRTAIGQPNGTPQFYFHWADNPQQLNDITSFFTDGESAPDRRFNYNFSTTEKVVVPETAYKANNIPGTIEFEDFNNGGAGVAYADATLGNSGDAYRTDESVDIESMNGGGYNLSSINTNEWLRYSIESKTVGTYTLNLIYASTTADNRIVVYVDGVDKSGVINFPLTDAINTTWATKSVDLQLPAGKYVVKILIENASGNFKLDKMEFVAKNVVTVGSGTGLSKSIYSASAGGRVWFQTLACSGTVDPVINQTWSGESPGCNVATDFWNIRWEGQIEPLYTETHTFYLTIKDMGRVWINNQLVVDAWTSANSGTTVTGTIDLVAGQKVPIKVDFAHKVGDAAVKLEWSTNSFSQELVPQSQLYPIDPNALPTVRAVNFGIYPNPAKNQVSIESAQVGVDNIKIVDLQGRVVFSRNEYFMGTKTIDLNLAKGVYFVKLTGIVPFEIQKLIVE